MGGQRQARLELGRDAAKRKLDSLLRPADDGGELSARGARRKKKRSGLHGGTHGVSLPSLSAIVCMDFVDGTCYVDIQRWDGRAMRTVGPAALHASLGDWQAFWGDGGGRLPRAKAAELRADLAAVSRPPSLAEELFGASDDEPVAVETEEF